MLKNIYIAFFLVLFTTGCFVADEIEFFDKINNPPQLLHANPLNTKINTAQIGTPLFFSVTVWEPDADDFSYYDARISLIEQLYSKSNTIETNFCNPPILLENNYFDHGVIINIECPLIIRTTTADIKNILILVEISDRGYIGGNIPDEDSKTLQVMWFYELLPENTL